MCDCAIIQAASSRQKTESGREEPFGRRPRLARSDSLRLGLCTWDGDLPSDADGPLASPVSPRLRDVEGLDAEGGGVAVSFLHEPASRRAPPHPGHNGTLQEVAAPRVQNQVAVLPSGPGGALHLGTRNEKGGGANEATCLVRAHPRY